VAYRPCSPEPSQTQAATLLRIRPLHRAPHTYALDSLSNRKSVDMIHASHEPSPLLDHTHIKTASLPEPPSKLGAPVEDGVCRGTLRTGQPGGSGSAYPFASLSEPCLEVQPALASWKWPIRAMCTGPVDYVAVLISPRPPRSTLYHPPKAHSHPPHTPHPQRPPTGNKNQGNEASCKMPRIMHRALATAAALLFASPLAHAGTDQQGYKACKVGGICTSGTPIGAFVNGDLNGPMTLSGAGLKKSASNRGLQGHVERS
jgi:hypothetical protein